MPKQKIAVRDKFYTLAKEQGYRARSAFKLIQLNRKYGLLDDASRAIDLCAAPGGWLQVCAKVMPPRPERQIIGVDLLPIKPLRGAVTFQADITTAECRKIIRHELKGNQADVVMCDGAPNVGSAYGKDAYVQSELALAALRFATDHLRKGGSFVTKVFRSADYNALIWALQQLFRKVEATKPTSSRNVSAEIFVVCRDYLAPDKIDPKLLDPKFVFAQVEPGAKDKDSKLPVSLLLGDEKKNAQKKFRAGYDDGAALVYKRARAIDFVMSDDPVRVLTESTELTFGDGSNDEQEAFLLSHPATTQEIKSLSQDIKVLGKSDFKHLLKWRMAVQKDLKKLIKEQTGVEGEDDEESKQQKKKKSEGSDEEDDEIALGKALLDLEESRKKEEKRLRKQQAKLQRYKDQGLIHPYAIDVAEQEGVFSLKSLGVGSTKDPRLDLFRDVDVAVPIDSERPDAEAVEDDEDDEEEEEENYSDLIEKQLEFDYERYSRKRALAEPMTVQERRRQQQAEKKAKMKKSTLERMTEEDFQRALEDAKKDAYEKGMYAKMLRKGSLPAGEASSSSDEEDEDDDADVDEEQSEDEDLDDGGRRENRKALIAKARAERWFNQQVFQDPTINEDDDDFDAEKIPLPRETLDKQKRSEKRKKEEERKARKKQKKEAKDSGESSERKPKSLQIVPADENDSKRKIVAAGDDDDKDGFDFDVDDAREDVKRRRDADPKVKALIEKGMGKKKFDKNNENQQIQIVSKEEDNRISKQRRAALEEDEHDLVEEYNSEDYDSDERAQHLALGALLAKKSTRNSVLDAAYNRYAFNDDALPAWFAEDESKHNRPNLPITKEMIESVKARFSDMNDRPIKKVAEARMRKKKRAQKKLEEAKRKAAAVVDEPDLSSRSKIRTIEKLFKGAEIKRPGSVYVVSQKGGGKKTSGGKSTKGKRVKVVDPRLKKDQRSAKRKAKKGGKGGNKRQKKG